MPASKDASLEPLGYQQYTGISAPTGLTLTSANAKRARYAMLKAEVQSVRWKDDEGLPNATPVSSSSGMLLDAGEEFWYTGKLSQLRFIQATAGSVLHVNLYA